MRILTDNLRYALQLAIAELERREKDWNGPSAIRAGFKDALEAIDRGERIEIQDK